MRILRLSRQKLSWIIPEFKSFVSLRADQSLPATLCAFFTFVFLVTVLIVVTLSLIDLANQKPMSFRLIERVTAPPIQDWNWFRSALPKPVVARSAALNLRNADINVELLGVMIGDEVSAATLNATGKPETVYQIGDEIKANVTITGKEANRIIIDQNGSPRQIKLKKPK